MAATGSQPCCALPRLLKPYSYPEFQRCLETQWSACPCFVAPDLLCWRPTASDMPQADFSMTFPEQQRGDGRLWARAETELP